MARYTYIACSLLLLTSCAIGPEYSRPATNISKTSNFINDVQTEGDVYPISHWWERIDDPLLKSYIENLLQGNLDLQQASERVIQAHERVNIQRGGLFPSLGAGADASRSFSSLSSNNRIYTTSYGTDLSTSWQVDLFGKIRRSVESASAGYEASLFDQQALTHALIAELLNRRIAIAVYGNRLELARQNVKNRKETYDLVKNRYDLGVQGTSAADVYLAEENYTSVQADVHEFERLLADQIYSFDVLLGQMPGTTTPLASDFPLLPPPLDVPLCMPADLLDRRPDLRASELRLAAATADIGIAVADLYPSLTLGAGIGFSGGGTGNLFTADQLAGNILASITGRLFEGGSLRANIRLQESEAREQAAAYAENVLNAVREVESALKAEQELAGQLKSIQSSVAALRQAEKLSQDRYLKGILSLQNYLDTQQRRYSLEQNLLIRQQEKWNARISLYLALGGDWFNESGTISCDHEGSAQ